MDQRFAIAILAAGKGTRLKSKHPKVLHAIAGRPLLSHVVHSVQQVVPVEAVFAIIGHEAERVRETVAATGINFIIQSEQKGTGHAIMMAREALSVFEDVLVLSGDVPMIRPETIASVRDFHLDRKAAMTILAAEPKNPFGYGRIVRKPGTDQVEAIVEQNALKGEQTNLPEINSGIYAFNVKKLFAHIDQLKTDNPHHEFYLTDMASILAKAGEKVMALRAENSAEVMGANTRAELAELDSLLRMRKARDLMDSGVTIFRPETCVIDAEVEVGVDTVIEPFVQLLGKTHVGPDSRIRSYSVITNSTIGAGVTILNGVIMDDSHVEHSAVLGPYSRLRPGSHICEHAKVGNFVETKKIRLGRGSKANHLTYLGDAEIGEGVNIGAGTITCNYDGTNKFKTVIEDGSFIGSDTTLVAPVTIGKGSYIGAASCVTKDVPQDSLAIARAPQVNKEGWVAQKREQKKTHTNK
jgi:bifunctional UDP-N-acetylglucosamine pyrophosphorylase / glucosamine-1-phosphate N-acetyltransferase